MKFERGSAAINLARGNAKLAKELRATVARLAERGTRGS